MALKPRSVQEDFPVKLQTSSYKWLHSSSDWKLAKNGSEQGNGHIHKDVPNGNTNKMYTTMPGTFRASKDLRITERADCGSIPGYNKTTNQN
jgi:hypothetical protein